MRPGFKAKTLPPGPALIFACLTLTFAGPVLYGQDTNAVSLTTTNQDQIQHFWQAMVSSHGPVTVLAFGDSVSDSYRSIQTSLFSRLQTEFGANGQSFAGPSQLDGGAAWAGPDTNWWAVYLDVPAGGRAVWAGGPEPAGSFPCDQAGLFWIAQPAGGKFTLSVSTNGGPWSEPVLTLSGFSQSPAGRYTNTPLPRANYRFRLDGLTGHNAILGPRYCDSTTNGIHIAFMAQDGQNLNTIFTLSTNVLYPILSGLNPQLVIWHMKELADIGATMLSNRLHDLEAMWHTCVTNGDIIYIGTPYEGRDLTTVFTPVQNALVRQAAIRSGRAYLDCMNPCISFSYMASHGLLGDSVHPSNLAYDYLANTVLWQQLGFFALGAAPPPTNASPITGPLSFGGDPAHFQANAWASWSPQEGELVLHNPSSQPSVIPLDPQALFDLPPGAPTVFDLSPVYAAERLPVTALRAGDSAIATLNPFETLVFAAHPRSVYPAQVLAASPIAYWRLGETAGPTAADQLGANPGRYVNATNHVLPGALAQQDDGAVQLTSPGSHVLVTNGAAFNFAGTNSFTLCVWVKLHSLNGVQRLFSTRDASSNGVGAGYALGIAGNTNLLFTAFGSGQVSVAVGQIPTAQWCHVAAVRRSDSVELYWNGAAVGTNSVGAIIPSSQGLQLGGNPFTGYGEEPFTGELDEAAVFTQPLSPTQIQALYLSQVVPLYAPVFTAQPAALARYAGAIAAFAAQAYGSAPLLMQWRRGSYALLGETSSALLLSNLTSAAAGDYTLLASNVAGVVCSAPATLTVITPDAYAATVLADYPLTYWRLNENIGPTIWDSAGTNNGAATGNVRFAQPGPLLYINQTAVAFSGTPGTQIDVPLAPALNPPVFSVECWAQAAGPTNSYQCLLASRDASPSGGYFICAEAAGHWSFVTGTTADDWHTNTGPPIVPGKWTFLAGIVDGTNQSFYVDGNLASASETVFYPNSRRPFRLGAGATESSGDFHFTGALAEVAFFGYALAPAQVQNHFRAASTIPVPSALSLQTLRTNLLLLWPTGSLQQADHPLGPWLTVTGAASPLLFQPTAPTRFYRLILPP